MPMVLMSGFVVNISEIPSWIAWFTYLDPVRYCYEAVLINGIPPEKSDPIDLLDQYGFYLGYSTCCWCMLGLVIFFRIFAYYLLVLKSKDSV